MSLLELFCHVDDFWKTFAPAWHQTLLQAGKLKRHRAGKLTASEIMTILIHFHQSHYRDFKAFYTEYVWKYLRPEFPALVSYSRFVELMPTVLVPLAAYLESCCGTCNGLSFVDSTKLAVCHNRRIKQHRVFAGLAERGKTLVDWFYGFKLPLVVNDEGAILACRLTPGNIDDRRPVLSMAQRLFGKLIGDKGYLSQELVATLLQQGVDLITPIKRTMKQRLVKLNDKLLLRKRAIIETITDQLKNISQIEHS
ncbi:MAG TPA: IS982 family transposase [Ktedonobacterales bacterium]|nr:IS982 family transposase [Ktedonobacterales bacterium]